jgi:hypothetical protein
MEELVAQWPRGTFTEVEAGHAVFDNLDAVERICQVIVAARGVETRATPGAGTPAS